MVLLSCAAREGHGTGSMEETTTSPSPQAPRHGPGRNPEAKAGEPPTKFAEAMSNPNWRDRRRNIASNSSTFWDLTASEAAKDPAESSPAGRRWKPVPVSAAVLVDDATAHGANPDCAGPMQPSGTQHLGGERPGRSHELSSKPLIGCCATSGMCDIVKHVDVSCLFEYDDPLSIIEVAPLGSLNSHQRPQSHVCPVPGRDRVQIRRIVKMPQLIGPRQNGSRDQRSAAAIQEVKRMPRKLRARQAHCEDQDFDKRREVQDANVQRARNAVLRDPAVADVGECHPDLDEAHTTQTPQTKEQDNLNSNHDDGDLLSFRTRSAESENLHLRDAAFQKMLQRLHRGSSFLRQNRSEGRKSKPVQIDACFTDQEKPLYPQPRCHPPGSKTLHPWPKTASSDSGIGLLPQDARMETNGDGFRREATNAAHDFLSQSLNPKAREFLSFAKYAAPALSQSPVQQEANGLGPPSECFGEAENAPSWMPSFAPLPLSRPSCCFPSLSDVYTQSHQHQLACLSAALLGPSRLICPLHGHGCLMSYVAPWFSHLDQSSASPQCLGAALQPQAPPSRLSDRHLNAVPDSAQNQGGTPISLVPPHPVRKPRRPDPGTQQAYEAWIEWRRANEPGYALECRRRQQRRQEKGRAVRIKPVSEDKATQVSESSCPDPV